jgi:hypothetical protein
MQWKWHLAGLSLCAVLTGCGFIAEHTAPKKQPSAARTAASKEADELLWSTLHAAAYEKISSPMEAQTAAYLENPNDAVTATHVGLLHLWRVSERSRLAQVPATITDDVTLARKYFEEAVELDPKNARYLGFLASATLAEGQIHHDERLTRRGYFLLLDAIDAWPEFNLFVGGYLLSSQPADSERFKQALNWQWKTLDVCAGAKVDRLTVNYSQYVSGETRVGANRACWNSELAPHNMEGFFLNMGDMLVKSGDWRTALKVYEDAKLSPTYSAWPYVKVLEERIGDAQANVVVFNAPVANNAPARAEGPLGSDSSAGPAAPAYRQMLAASSINCVVCHQK